MPLSIAAANVKLKGNVSPPIIVQVGEAVTQGQPGYAKTTDSGKYWRADADTLAESLAEGIFMTAAATDGYALLAKRGCKIDLGATLTVGSVLCVSATVGGIDIHSDVASGDYVTIIGVPDTSSSVTLLMEATQVAKP